MGIEEHSIQDLGGKFQYLSQNMLTFQDAVGSCNAVQRWLAVCTVGSCNAVQRWQ